MEIKEVLEWGKRGFMDMLDSIQRGESKRTVDSKQKKRKTTQELKNLLDSRVQQKVLPLSQNNLYGKINLEPQVKSGYDGVYVRFRIGADKLYVLKDVISFAQAVIEKENVRYGKQLEFVHTIEVFAPESRPMVQFILDWVSQNKEQYAERYYYSSYYTQYQKVRDIYFNRVSVDDFFDAAASCGLLLEEEKKKIYPKIMESSEMPGVLSIKGTENGAKVHLDIPALWDGNRCFNFIFFDEVERIPIEKIEPVKDFILCLNRLDYEEAYIQEEDLPAFCRDVAGIKGCTRISR